MLNMKDNEGEYFQNIYPYATSMEDTIEKAIAFIETITNILIAIESIDYCYNIDSIKDLISMDNFEGYIQNIKHYYDN